jgi:hypothetical protein
LLLRDFDVMPDLQKHAGPHLLAKANPLVIITAGARIDFSLMTLPGEGPLPAGIGDQSQ